MEFLKFKEKLKNNGIFLFDSEYRKCYQNYKILNQYIHSAESVGFNHMQGGSYYKPDNIFNNSRCKKKIQIIINALNNNNFKKAEYARKKCFNPIDV